MIAAYIRPVDHKIKECKTLPTGTPITTQYFSKSVLPSPTLSFKSKYSFIQSKAWLSSQKIMARLSTATIVAASLERSRGLSDIQKLEKM